MPIATADQLRNRPTLVLVPGTDLQIQVRRPDPLALIADGTLPLPIFGEILAKLIATVREESDADANATADTKVYYDLVDRWACAAAVAPRIVLTEAEADADPATLWVQDLPREVRLEIVRATHRALASGRLKTAVMDFRSLGSAGAGPGSDGTPVRDETVGALVGA